MKDTIIHYDIVSLDIGKKQGTLIKMYLAF
jgi:hypothetical protein